MPNYENSQDYTAIDIKDVNQAFRSILAKRPTVSSLIPFEGKATNHTHNWLEYKKSPKEWQTDGATVATTTTLVFDSNVGLKVGDVLKFTASTGASVSVKVKVLTVDAGGTDITVTRPYGGTTDMTIADDSIVSLVSRAQAEGTGEDLDANTILDEEYNYTQIFRRDLKLSRTTLQTKLQGLATEADVEAKVMTLINFQIAHHLADIAYEYNNSVIDGVREKRVEGGANGSFGGIVPFLEANAESKYDASAADVSELILNNAVAKAVENGAVGSDLTVMLCHGKQARKISAFNTSGTNPVVQLARTETTTGSYVLQFQSDLAATNGGALTIIVVDPNFAQDKIAILDMENIKGIPMENFSVTETTDKKTDGRTWKLIGEVTLELKNMKDGAMLIHNLKI